MRYFPETIDADNWRENNCEKGTRCCIHYPRVVGQPGCPILVVSQKFNEQQCAGKTFDDAVKAKAAGIHEVLEALVPTGEDGFAQDCPFRMEAK